MIRASRSRISATSCSRRGPSLVRTAETVIAAAGCPSGVLIQVEIDFVPCTRPISLILYPRFRAVMIWPITVAASVWCAPNLDWPHPVSVKQPPNDADLLELMFRFANDQAELEQILVHNPAKLFGFPD